ncbi:GGDEF domain-containing protein [Polymorphospora sp. NPDC051019]|uniref:GGDEF domain-containing protein n=1 Tax=Polymorphospora sp. NPDC051019 TaxID=3155725 RepID=UPI0034304681
MKRTQNPTTTAPADSSAHTLAGALRYLAAVGIAATAGYLTARHTLLGDLAAARHAATHDPLTGIRNRAGLTATADSAIAAGRTVVALVDLVGFKKVNDTYGHDAGDHILTATADRLTDIAGPDGIAARLGGDEFALITEVPGSLPDWLSPLHARLTAPVTYHGRHLAVGVTVGAVLADPGQPVAVWLYRADLAMYAARSERRASAVFTDHTEAAADMRPVERVRDLARPTSPLTAAPTAWRAA